MGETGCFVVMNKGSSEMDFYNADRMTFVHAKTGLSSGHYLVVSDPADFAFSGSAYNSPTSMYHYGVKVADMNADGKLDIVAASSSGSSVYPPTVLKNTTTVGTTGSFTFTQLNWTLCPNANANGIAVGELTGDQYPDLVLARTNMTAGVDTPALEGLANAGDGSVNLSWGSSEDKNAAMFDTGLTGSDIVTLDADGTNRMGVAMSLNNTSAGTGGIVVYGPAWYQYFEIKSTYVDDDGSIVTHTRLMNVDPTTGNATSIEGSSDQ